MAVLTPLTDPYASVRVAVYEPLITTWCSVPGLDHVLKAILERAVPLRSGPPPGGNTAPTVLRFDWIPAKSIEIEPGPAPAPGPRATAPVAGVTVSARVRTSARALGLPDDEQARRAEIVEKLRRAGPITPDEVLEALTGAGLPHLLARGGLHAMLSPIGVAHLYRQLYFDAGAGMGPIEHALTVAPLEQVEVIQELVRRDSVERTESFGTESTLEKSAEESTTEEISDHVQSTVRRDAEVGISASAQGSFAVWSGQFQSSLNYAQSSERSRETARTRATSTTKKSSEVIRKSYSLTVKTFTELDERSTIKRVIKNEGPTPVNYGLRRVMRTINVKLQSLGPRLVWQSHVKDPGVGLALGDMVMFRDSDALAPGTAPTAPPRPVGGVELGTQRVRAIREGIPYFIVTIPQDPMRIIRGLTITSVSNADPREGDRPPGVLSGSVGGEALYGPTGAVVAWAFKFNVVGDGWALDVEYSLVYEPSEEALALWQDQVRTAQIAWDAQKADEAIERARRMLTAKSRIRPRPFADLREEERYEILGRMISGAFGNLPPGGRPAPAEMELFHRYFEVSALFYWVHPSWWVPRQAGGRGHYQITDESEPAPFGRSLGWLIQLDGDRRRNEFLNSPWIRACVPLRPGVEREAMTWLAHHVEGTSGFSVDPGTALGELLASVEAQRALESVGAPGPDYVTLDGRVPQGREDSAQAYPVIDEFDVTVPTEGFVYDLLTSA